MVLMSFIKLLPAFPTSVAFHVDTRFLHCICFFIHGKLSWWMTKHMKAVTQLE